MRWCFHEELYRPFLYLYPRTLLNRACVRWGNAHFEKLSTYRRPLHDVQTNDPIVMLRYVGPRWWQSKQCLLYGNATISRKIFKWSSSCFFFVEVDILNILILCEGGTQTHVNIWASAMVPGFQLEKAVARKADRTPYCIAAKSVVWNSHDGLVIMVIWWLRCLQYDLLLFARWNQRLYGSDVVLESGRVLESDSSTWLGLEPTGLGLEPPGLGLELQDSRCSGIGLSTVWLGIN